MKQSIPPGLVIGAIGVVFGDIGTSPLYAVRVAFSGPQAIAPTVPHVLGVASLIVWSLAIVVGLKYAVCVLQADNRGEGGIMALMALALRGIPVDSRRRQLVMLAGLAGAALFFGDAIITPAISVMSAVEGVNVMFPGSQSYVVSLVLAILIALFLLQYKGTAYVGGLFGPVMGLWFLCLAVLGIRGIAEHPSILAALNPWHAVRFLVEARWQTLVVLGAVVLVVTGAEALYADIGHFGAGPIRRAWFRIVMPALTLNYLGQGALLLSDPAAADHPFYRLAPAWGVTPLLALATLATIIASQAVISGTFSITRQAIQLGYLPRLRVTHTSAGRIGQVYVPAMNWILAAAVVAVVLGFHGSAHLAAAYGMAVTGTMVITTLLAAGVLPALWHWHRVVGTLMFAGFFIVDLGFLVANGFKLAYGGWFPLLIGAALFTVMSTWKTGREILIRRLNTKAMALEKLAEQVRDHPPPRVPGTAVYLTAGRWGAPQALLHNLATNKILHERVIVLTMVIRDVPWVPREERIKLRHFGDRIFRLRIYYGFNQEPDIPFALELCQARGLDLDLTQVSFFLGRETLVSTPGTGMARWRERLFIRLAKNSESAMEFLHIPPEQVIELGAMVEV